MNTTSAFDDALKTFIEGAQAIVTKHHQEFGWTPEMYKQQHETLVVNPKSRRYIGIFSQRGCDTKPSRIYAFIDSTNGDVLKPATYKAPAKTARGNIFDASNGLANVNHYGPAYLR